MNNDRRLAIAVLKTAISDLRVAANSIRDEIETISNEEQDYFDNMPESIQTGEKGDKAQAAISALDAAMDVFGVIVTEIEFAENALDEAAE